MQDLIDAVKAYAREHYEENGWDEIVECFGNDEIKECLQQHMGTVMKTTLTPAEAIKFFGEMCKIRYEYRRDIEATIF